MDVGQSRQRRSLFVSPLRRADDGYRPLPRFVRAVASIAAVVRQPAFSPIMGCEKAVAFPLQHLKRDDRSQRGSTGSVVKVYLLWLPPKVQDGLT